MASREVDVFFLKHGCPLEGSSVQTLAVFAVAVHGICWLSANFILDRSTKARRRQKRLEVLALAIRRVSHAQLDIPRGLEESPNKGPK